MSPARRALMVATALALHACDEPSGSPLGPLPEDGPAVRGVRRVTDFRACADPARDARGGFCDDTARWGVDLRFAILPGGDANVPGGVSAADFDGDGRVDLLVTRVQNAPVVLLLNRGGRLEDATATWGLDGFRAVFSSRAADLDGDGRPDLVLSVEGAPRLHVLRNDGARFVPMGNLDPTIADAVPAMALADFDGDGLLDLVAAGYAAPGECPRYLVRDCPGILHAFRQTAPWVFARMPVEAPARRTQAISAMDLDDDGALEVYAVADFGMFEGANVRLVAERTPGGFVLRNRTAGSGFDLGIFGMGVGALDIDGDQRDELVVTNIGRNAVLRLAGGRLVDVTAALGGGGYGMALDGAPPVYRTYDEGHPFEGPVSRYARDYLAPSSGLYALTKWEVVVADFDRDGWEDVFTPCAEVDLRDLLAEAAPQASVMLLGTGRRLVDRTVALGLDAQRPARSAAPADLDGDGDLDLVLVRASTRAAEGGLTILRNDLAGGNGLRVTARGRGAMRDAVGAVVTARVGDRTMRRRVDGNLGTYASRAPDVYLGLGPAQVVDELTVRFPSGRTARRTAVPRGEVVVEEPPP